MFNPFKKIFNRRGDAAVEAAREFRPQTSARSAAPAPAPRAATPRPAARADVAAARSAAPAPVNVSANLGIPIKSIIARLPAELMQRVGQLDVGEAEVFVPMQKILSQISSGAVKISFGELRQLTPPGTFTPENDRDRVMVELPLHEILGRLNPSLLTRRPAQRQVEVPNEVTGPFGGQTPLAISAAPAKAPAPAQPVNTWPTAPAATPGRAAPAAMPVVSAPFPVLQPTAPIPPRPAAVPAQPQPIAARIRATVPQKAAQPVPAFAAAAPAQSGAKMPALWQEESYTPPPAAPVAPVRTAPPAPVAPIAPFAPAPVMNFAPGPFSAPLPPQTVLPQSGDTEVIHMSDTFTRLTNANVNPISPIAPSPAPEPTPIPFAVQEAEPEPEPEPEAEEMPSFIGETRFLNASLADLSLTWPEAVRQEIHAQHLFTSNVGLPMGAVEGIIRTGKVAFPWKALRSWIRPHVPPAASQFDTAMLELPLKVITPLFLNELKGNRTQRRVAVDASIPNLFSGAPPVESVVPNAAPVVSPAPPAPVALPVPPVAAVAAAPTPVFVAAVKAAPVVSDTTHTARPSDTNYFVRGNEEEEASEEVPVFTKKPDGRPNTAFLNRYATPNEIVTKASSLGGVDGALIALPDGLLVASRIPASMNADTIAAFLPQIFSRVSQSTRELRLGELNNLNFTVGNIPWKIFRVGSIYFAVFGRPGEALPTAQLVGLAAELDRKAK